MREYQFIQADVFTDRPFTGNPLAIFPEAEGLSSEEMQSIAKEMNLSETTFVLPATDLKAQFRLRIFTPGSELPSPDTPSSARASFSRSVASSLSRKARTASIRNAAPVCSRSTSSSRTVKSIKW